MSSIWMIDWRFQYWSELMIRLVIIVAGVIVGIQFLTIIIQGIRASELKRDKMLEEPLVVDVVLRREIDT